MKGLPLAKIIFLTILFVGFLYESKSHFDQSLVKTNIERMLGQYHWNLFFPQRVIYQNSSFRYLADFYAIEKIIKPESFVLSDIATSHYATASLPVYIKNTQPHQGRYRGNANFSKLFDKLDFCYMDNPVRKLNVLETLIEETSRTGKKYYILLNRDGANRNLHFECLATRDQYVKEYIKGFTNLMFSGKYLDLYEIEAVNLTPSSLENSY